MVEHNYYHTFGDQSACDYEEVFSVILSMILEILIENVTLHTYRIHVFLFLFFSFFGIVPGHIKN